MIIGLQKHALWRMDGRTWIESYTPSKDETYERMRKIAIEKGQLIILPNDKLCLFLEDIIKGADQ